MAFYKTDSNKNLKKIAGKNRQLPLGAIFCSAVLLTDPAYKRLDGQSISINGVYAKFCQWLISQSSLGNAPTCTIAEYGTELATYGQCGKFVINNTNSAVSGSGLTLNANSIKLPTITAFIESSNNTYPIGTTKGAGLPNITGRLLGKLTNWATFAVEPDANLPNNAFERVSTEDSQETIQRNDTKYGVQQFNFDASRSNSTYGNSNTVQPKAVSYPYYIVVATNTLTQAEIDMENIANDLNQKAQKDLSNVSYPENVAGMTTIGAGDRVIESYISSDGKTWYRKWASGWKECGGIFTSNSAPGSNAGNSKDFDFNLPLSFSDTNYSIHLTNIWMGQYGHSIDWDGGGLSTKTVNSFVLVAIRQYTQSNAVNSVGCNWYACGY